MSESIPSANSERTAAIKFVFNHCNDIQAVRRFYGELVGMKESAYNEGIGYLCYRTGGFDFMFFNSESLIKVNDEFSDQPGYEGGPGKSVSWAIEVPEEDFAATVERLRCAGIKCYRELPDWRQDSYWGFTVLDPMGVTVEVYTVPSVRPADTGWPSA